MKVNKLTQSEIDEVSLVNIPANKRRFMFFKSESGGQDIKIDLTKEAPSVVIKTDGTVGGTKVTVNGKTVANISDFTFGFFSREPGAGEDSSGSPVVMQYTTKSDKTDTGFAESQTYTLSKGVGTEDSENIILKATADQRDSVSRFVSDEAVLNRLTGSVVAKLEKSLDVLADYQDAFPVEVTEAVTALVASAVNGGTLVAMEKGETEMADKEKETEVETATTSDATSGKTEPKTEPKLEVTQEMLDQLADRAAEVLAERLGGKEAEKELRDLKDGEQVDTTAYNRLLSRVRELEANGKTAPAAPADGKTTEGKEAEDEEIEVTPEMVAEAQAEAEAAALELVTADTQ